MKFGHYYLQYKLQHIDENQISIFDFGIEDNITIEKEEKDSKEIFNSYFNEKNEIYRFSYKEWQPNYFSSCILVPKLTLDKVIKAKFNIDRIPQNYFGIYDKNQYLKILYELKEIFSVTPSMLANRINSFGYRYNDDMNWEQEELK